MSIFRHLTVGLTYCLIALGVGVVVPRLFRDVGETGGMLLGGLMLVAFALLHEVLTRQDAITRLTANLEEMRKVHDDLMLELGNARGEFQRIHDAIAAAGPRKNAKELAEDVSKVVAEVRLLQTLVDQLSTEGAAQPMRVGQGTSRHVSSSGSSQAAALPAAPGTRLTLIDGGDADAAENKADGGADRTAVAESAVDGATPAGTNPVARSLDDSQILSIIQDGLRRDRVDLVLQPIVTLPQRKRKFLEAFTRIRASDETIIVPEQYIAIAEREGLINAIDNMLLFRCVQILRKMQGRERNVGFFCNISPYTLADGAFFRDFVEFMSENAELAPNLIFEFAQATIANRDDDILRQLGRLAAMGFRFSMDQVASLNLDYRTLARQHFRFVKIEAETLLRNVGKDSAALDIDVQTLKRTLERHGIDLIVEKIESEPMLLELLDYHIDYGQGYLFGEPRTSANGG